MKALRRILVAATAVLAAAGAPALAQETPAPAQNELIGSPQLRDFSLNGTVTREANAPAPVQPQQRPRETGSPSTGERAQSTPARPTQTRESAPATARPETPAREQTARSADLPPPTPARRMANPRLAPENGLSPLNPQPAFVPAPAESGVDGSPGGMPMLPWLIALLALVGAAAWYFLRQRPRESFAGAAGLNAFDAPAPAPVSARPKAPPVRTPPPAAPPKPASAGIVSTRLRPWLEIEFAPERAVVDEQKAAVAFELTVFNSGSAPAREVMLEASLFNAGPMQDQQIQLFFENPVAKGDRIPIIPPLQRVAVNTAVFLPRDQVRTIELEGRELFVPLIAFNALYSWASGAGQSSVSYLIGKQTNGEKLAPFRLDLGPRIFRNLAAREHELRLRK